MNTSHSAKPSDDRLHGLVDVAVSKVIMLSLVAVGMSQQRFCTIQPQLSHASACAPMLPLMLPRMLSYMLPCSLPCMLPCSLPCMLPHMPSMQPFMQVFACLHAFLDTTYMRGRPTSVPPHSHAHVPRPQGVIRKPFFAAPLFDYSVLYNILSHIVA